MCCRVSKLYVKDACVSDRDNELGFDTVKHVRCSSTDDTETTTCNTVFSDGEHYSYSVLASSRSRIA